MNALRHLGGRAPLPKKFWKLCSGSFFVTIVKTALAFCVNKFLAVFLGPSAFACVAQFQNFVAIGQGASSLALQNGWVSLSAREKNNSEKLFGLWRGGFRLMVFGLWGLLFLGVLFAFFAPLEKFFPGIPLMYSRAAVLFALPGIAASNVSLVCLSVLNGLGAYRRWAILSLSISFIQCAWVVLLLYFHAFSLLAIIATQSILTVLIAIPLARSAGFSFKVLTSSIAREREDRKPWIRFMAMGLLPMILSPLALLIVRETLAKRFGWEAAGVWQGAFRISDFFSVGVSSVASVVLLPKISEVVLRSEFQKIFYPLLLRVLLCVLCCAFFFFLFREWLVSLFLSREFFFAAKILPFQLLGDFFRAGGFCCAMALIASQETKKFLTAEIISQFAFPFLSIFLLSWAGIFAPSIAYAIENAIYFLLTLFLVRKISWKAL